MLFSLGFVNEKMGRLLSENKSLSIIKGCVIQFVGACIPFEVIAIQIYRKSNKRRPSQIVYEVCPENI